MNRAELIFLLMLDLNAIVAFSYLFWWVIFKRKIDNRKQYAMNTAIMLLCPIIGILYYLISYFKFRFIKLGERDLSDVEFSKKRQIARVKADENRERNIVSVGEAVLISDKEKKRVNMLNVLLGDTDESYSAIALALGSDDSEVAHYAASFLQSKTDTFRENVRKAQRQIAQDDIENEECQDLVVKLILYMNHMLKQKVFTQIEQTDYLEQMEELCKMLYQNARAKLTGDCYECLISRLIDQLQYEKAERWANRFCEQHPDLSVAYKLRMKIYFETNNMKQFVVVLDELRASSISVDHQTLELMRMIQTGQTEQ